MCVCTSTTPLIRIHSPLSNLIFSQIGPSYFLAESTQVSYLRPHFAREEKVLFLMHRPFIRKSRIYLMGSNEMLTLISNLK